MNPIQRYFVRGVLLGSLLLFEGCPKSPPHPSGSDLTPPEFVQVVAQLETPSGPNPRGVFDITSQDVSSVGLGSDLTIRITALAGDPESAIGSIAIESDLTWQCSFGHGSQTVGIAEKAPLAFTQINPPSSPVTPVQISVVADPISQTGCDRSAPGKGPINIRGSVRVVATNGAGLQVRSKTFIFDYANIGTP